MKSKFVGLLICCFIILTAALVACSSAPAAMDKPAGTEKPAAAQTPAANAAQQKQKPTLSTDIDDAAHQSADMVYEWWYLDAAFDNGYSVGMSWQIIDKPGDGSGPIRLIQFAIYDPQGKKTDVEAKFDPAAVNASKTNCDVTMGNNHLKGSYPRWNVDFRQGDLGCNLIFDSLIEGFKTPPDGLVYFTKQPARWIGWVIAQPRAKVTGTLILNGKEIAVTGVGYHDHNWGNTFLNDMYHHWYWGRIFLPDYTFIYSVGQMTDALGAKPSSVIFTYKGSDLLDVSTNIFADASDLVLDEYSGAKYPRALVLRLEGPTVKGTISHHLKNVVEKQITPGAKPGEGRVYFRFLSDCDINLNIAGEKLEVHTPLLHEYMIP